MIVNLDALNKLVAKLNQLAEEAKNSSQLGLQNSENRIEYATQLSMAYGLAAGISVEASGVMMDFLRVLKKEGLGIASAQDLQSMASTLGLKLDDMMGDLAPSTTPPATDPKKNNKAN